MFTQKCYVFGLLHEETSEKENFLGATQLD